MPAFPQQVARMLVNMHNQVAAGDFSYVQQMRAAGAAQAAAAASQRAPNGVPDADEDSSLDEDGSETGSDGTDAEVGSALAQWLQQSAVQAEPGKWGNLPAEA